MENINENDPTPEDNTEMNADTFDGDELGVEPSTNDAVESDSTEAEPADVEPSDAELADDADGFEHDQESSFTIDEDAEADLDADANDLTLDETTDVAADDTIEVDGATEFDGHDLFDDVSDATDPVDETSPTNDAGTPNPPPPVMQPVPAAARLTRDPFATFGGVLSGIAHHYGWDVSLTRLAFILVVLFTGGTAFLAYFLAWLIIPRATHWPPAPSGRRPRSGLSGRDVGIGLLGLAALVALGAGSGSAASVLVPLALVGGGIYMLVQNPREQQVAAFAGMPTDTVSPAAHGASAPAQAPIQTYAAAPAAPVAQQPAPRRSRGRRVAVVGAFGLLGLFLLGLVLTPLIIFGAITDGDFDLEFDGDPIVFDYDTVEAIPSVINEDAGEILIDLRRVDFSEVTADNPVDLEVNLDAGEIVVRLPEDVNAQIDAESDFVGEVVVFGREDDGFSPEISNRDSDPQLILDLEVNAGRIEVVRETFAN